MKTKSKVAGAPLVPPPIEQVEQESAILEKILSAKLYELLIQEAMRLNISPFHMLNNYVAESALHHIMAKVQAAYKPNPRKPDTAPLLRDRVTRWDPARGMR